ncbi:MAG TPA: DNA replication/repair protein RecF [Steroidobacteraceae bacterium]|nr:DNA replication/repair protein RecF [Steroidobacteraceae bacterium]
MPLLAVQVENLRCVRNVDLQLDDRLTVITGANGAGKTSLLEAIFFLGRGRSFRTRQIDRLITTGTDAMTLIGHFGGAGRPSLLGIRASRDGTEAHINGRRASSLAELATAFPVQVIDPSIHKLVEEGPSGRRRAVDWGAFHVEPTFAHDWQRFQRALRQRNASLRSQLAASAIKAWDAELVAAGTSISQARERYFEQLQPVVRATSLFLAGVEAVPALYQGWPQGDSLELALAQAWTKDLKAGTTTVGPHRADLRIRLEGQAARDRASRGQQKLIAAALVLSQLRILQKTRGQAGTLLLDDPAAELDSEHLARLMSQVRELGSQLVATTVSSSIVGLEDPGARFHVEQGAATRML